MDLEPRTTRRNEAQRLEPKLDVATVGTYFLEVSTVGGKDSSFEPETVKMQVLDLRR